MPTVPLRYLALGDSYTIGEGVPAADTWPYALARAMRLREIPLADPEVIAVTGWSTDELLVAVDRAELKPQYALVSLLIGANNAYRGRSVDNYREELASLVARAQHLRATDRDYVLLVSIPDWGATPFATSRDRAAIGRVIDAFNAAARELAAHVGVTFVDITGISRRCGADPEMLVEDRLHPSAAQYAQWLPPIAAAARKLLWKP